MHDFFWNFGATSLREDLAQIHIYVITHFPNVYLIKCLSFQKMAWESKGEELRETLKAYVGQLTLEQKRDLRKTYDRALAPFFGE